MSGFRARAGVLLCSRCGVLEYQFFRRGEVLFFVVAEQSRMQFDLNMKADIERNEGTRQVLYTHSHKSKIHPRN